MEGNKITKISKSYSKWNSDLVTWTCHSRNRKSKIYRVKNIINIGVALSLTLLVNERATQKNYDVSPGSKLPGFANERNNQIYLVGSDRFRRCRDKKVTYDGYGSVMWKAFYWFMNDIFSGTWWHNTNFISKISFRKWETGTYCWIFTGYSTTPPQ